MTRIHQTETNNDSKGEFLGYCAYCKNPVYQNEEHVNKKDGVYHLECWKQKNGFEEELDFEK